MGDKRYIELFSNPGTVPLKEIPVLPYDEFTSFIDRLMGEEGTHCLSYFVLPEEDRFCFICCMAADENHAILVFSHEQPRRPVPVIASLTRKHFQFHIFEREIHENFGVGFEGHPWLKPVRFPFGRADSGSVMDNYPFYAMESDELHEVGVGPIHAGIIEPGYFRFICHGEQVLHLEIHLGYQHRAVERLLTGHGSFLRKSILAESMAGDTAVGHSLAFAMAVESLGGTGIPKRLSLERSVALEMERIAIHLGDTAALCTDIAYQFGQVVNEALRTIIINTTQLWCGNRFGKGMIRPGGTNYPMSPEIAGTILKNLAEVEERYRMITARIFSLPSVLGRFEGTGRVTAVQASLAGAVGMAARSSGMYRDIRWSHPFAGYRDYPCEPEILDKGDVWSRAMLRRMEVERSVGLIREMLKELPGTRDASVTGNNGRPGYDPALAPSSLAVSLVEGWRGEICHVIVTGENGEICHYKAKDPSLHNWMMLALAVRGQEISDFPLCNKSFNLSYCGNDL